MQCTWLARRLFPCTFHVAKLSHKALLRGQREKQRREASGG